MEEQKEEGNSNVEEEPKNSSRKTRLEARIEDFQARLNVVDSDLEKQEVLLNGLKKHLAEEQENKEACVAHLQRILKYKTDECVQVQHDLQLVRDMAELSEHRAANLTRNVERNRQVTKNSYLQQKRELEGKLSALEEKRIKKNTQLPHLKRLEDALEEKISSKCNREREENKMQVSRLLEKKRNFEELVDSLCSKACSVFDLSLPVHVKEELRDNVLLRHLYEDTAERILMEQDHSRRMKALENTLEVEMDILSRVETFNKTQKLKLKKQLESLVQEIRPSLSDSISNLGEDLDKKKSEINKRKNALYKVVDLLVDLNRIVKDQDEYKQSLENELRKKIDSNGQKLSAILRAGKMVRSRIEDVAGKTESYLDIKLLEQIRMFLDENAFDIK